MSLVRESLLFNLLSAMWRRLCRAYDESWLCRVFCRFDAWLRARWEHSFCGHFFYGDSRISADWDTCLVRRVSEWVLNLPARLLRWIYRRLKGLFDASFFAGLAFELGREADIAAGWCAALILVIPYEYWSNTYSFILFVLVTGLFFLGLMNGEGRLLSLKHIGPYVVLFYAAVAAAVPLSNHPWLSLRFLTYHATCFLAVLVIVNAVTESGQLLRLAGGLAMGILVAALYGIYQGRVTGVEVVAAYVDSTVNTNMPGRVYSFFDNPNALGQLLLFVMPVLVALVFAARRRISRLCAAGIFCVCLVCMVMTYCRAAWIGLAVAAFVYVLLWNRKLIPLGILAALAALPLLPDSVLNRILTIGNLRDTSTTSRFLLYASALRLLTAEPITGAGLGVDSVRLTVRERGLYRGRGYFVHSHNTYLQVWAECGLLGILALVGALVSVTKSAVRALGRGGDAAARHMAIGGVSALIGAAVCGLADYLWTYPRIMLIFWYVFALTLAAVKLCNRDPSRPEPDPEAR